MTGSRNQLSRSHNSSVRRLQGSGSGTRPFQIGTLNGGSTFAQVLLGLADVVVAQGWVLRPNTLNIEILAGNEPPPPVDVCVVPPGADEAIRWLRSQQIPVIVVKGQADTKGIVTFVPDSHAIGQAAAQHLLERGLRNFAAFSLVGHVFANERIAAFIRTVQQAGGTYLSAGAIFQPPEQPIQPGNRPLTMATIRQWISELPKPVGVFVPCDNWASLVLTSAMDLRCPVPTQLAVVSADNDEWLCQTSSPPLSSVIIPWCQIGTSIGELIARTLAAGRPLPPESIVVPPAGVAVRQSSDMLAVPDPDVAAALAFIRGNALQFIDVSDVLRAVPVTRKRLEAGFRRCVGHGMMYEVRRLRVQEAQRLLALTPLSMVDIAARTGFPTQHKLATLFRRFTGVTPTQYRRRFRL